MIKQCKGYGVLLGLLCITASTLYAQVGINIQDPDSSAILHLESIDKGLLLPRLNDAQMNGIGNPAEGLILYNTEDSLVEYWNGECWIKPYQRTCDDCEFIMTIDQTQAIIDRAVTDSASFTLTVEQTNGSDDINLVILTSLPAGVTYSADSFVIDSFGTSTITVTADIFAQPGTFPVIVQAVCGQFTQFIAFTVIVEPCELVPLNASTDNFLLSDNVNRGLPGDPACIIVDIADGVEIGSTDAGQPAFNTGNLDVQSHVGFIHEGSILGRGGNGGGVGNILQLQFGEDGEDGGDAINLTTRATFDLGGEIYAGGGGGAGVGVGLTIPLSQIPIISFPDLFLGFGFGGGGGSESGIGGQIPAGVTVIGQLDPGQDATASVFSIPGDGANFTVNLDLLNLLGIPSSINAGVGSINFTAAIGGQVNAGDGGAFGQAGQASSANVSATLAAELCVIFIGCTDIFNFNPTFPIGIANGGQSGLAVRTNGNTVNNLQVPNLFILGNIQ